MHFDDHFFTIFQNTVEYLKGVFRVKQSFWAQELVKMSDNVK